MVQSQAYQDASRILLAQAFLELEQGDTRQASEKGWGAAAQMLKCIAEQRGWEHKGHRLIRRTASRLSDETGNSELRRLYRVADSLHINFYEDLDTREDVSAGLEDVKRLLDVLEPLAGRARYLAHPDSNVVHREGGCADAQTHGNNWLSLGHFASIADAAAQESNYRACSNCLKLVAEKSNRI